MPGMTDPSDALKSFQEVLDLGNIELQPGAFDPELFVHFDTPNGKPRFTYVRIETGTVTALVMLVRGDVVEGVPYFDIGYAVPEPYRNQGRAKNAVMAAIAELKHGLARGKIPTFHVEAVVGADNTASQKVALQTISSAPVAITDHFSGLPAFHYVRKVGSA